MPEKSNERAVGVAPKAAPRLATCLLAGVMSTLPALSATATFQEVMSATVSAPAATLLAGFLGL